MVEGSPIYAPDLPERIPGQVRKVVQITGIPEPIAETIGELAEKRNQIPDDVAATAILRLQFYQRHEMSGRRIVHRIPGENLFGGEDIVRELDFGFTGPEHQGFQGRVRRFLRRHNII